MRFLGIDYGVKRVGLALSDANGRFALPYSVVPEDEKLIPTIKAICDKEQVGKIVIGESRDLKGQANPVMKKIARFRERLAQVVDVPLEYEPEFFTSTEAARLPGGGVGAWSKDEFLDARAAALILKSYLDKHGSDKN